MKLLLRVFPIFDNKLKTHVVAVHAISDLLRFGSLLDLNTEKYEQVNSIGKQAYSQSNKKCPSKDITLAESRRLCCQFLRAGGNWLLHGNVVVSVGADVSAFLSLPMFSPGSPEKDAKGFKMGASSSSLDHLDSTWDL